jgi:ribosomal protein S18 acetylase RimI-like enzyme
MSASDVIEGDETLMKSGGGSGILSGMLVRRVREDELDRLRELRLRALLDAPGAFGRRHDEEAGRGPEEYRGWVTDGSTLVVEDDKGWHGLVAMLVDREDPSLCHLASMWTEPAYRGQGLGRMLVEAALSWARVIGAVRVRLGVVEDNWPAIHLYEQAGFEPTAEREPLRSDPTKSVVFMARDCAGDA